MQIFYLNNVTGSLTRLFLYMELGKPSIVTRLRVGRLSIHGSNSGGGELTYFFLCVVRVGSGVHPAICLMHNGGSFVGDEAAGT